MSIARSLRENIAAAGAGAILATVGAGIGRAILSRNRERDACTPWLTFDQSNGVARLVHAAVLAANAHNTQPWRFEMAQGCLTVRADLERNIGCFDPYRREMYQSLGCAIENLVVAAQAQGLEAQVEVLPGRLPPSPGDEVAARVRLRTAANPVVDLSAAITRRATNRGAYLSRPLPPAIIEELQGVASETSQTHLGVFTAGQRDSLGEVIVAATKEILADEAMSADNAHWYRFSPGEVARHRDGLTLDANVAAPLTNLAARALPPSARRANRQWARDTRNIHVRTAQLLGIIAVRNPYDRPQAIAVGRLWQRIHLLLTRHGIAAQPLNQPVEIVDRQRQLGRPPTMRYALETFVSSQWQPTFLFRAGYPRYEARHSPRRAIADAMRQTGRVDELLQHRSTPDAGLRLR